MNPQAAAAAALANLPPVSKDIVNLAIAELVIYGSLLPPMLWITWKHGKPGFVTWQIFVSFIVARYVADIAQIVNRNKPAIPSGITIITDSASVATLILTLIGMIYEAYVYLGLRKGCRTDMHLSNIILPHAKKPWTERGILAAFHLTTTIGIGIATSGGAPDPTKLGAPSNPTIQKAGFVILIVVLLSLGPWAYWTLLKIGRASACSVTYQAKVMVWAAVAGAPVQLIRVIYGATFSFDPLKSLDPTMGSFLTKFELIFLPQLGVTLCVLVGGWFGITPKLEKRPGTVELFEIDHGNNGNGGNSGGAVPVEWQQVAVTPKSVV